jgi:hypothetical protein
MLKDTTVIRLRQPDVIDDPLSELAREGARRYFVENSTDPTEAVTFGNH